MQVLAKLGAGVYGDKEMTAKVAGKLDFRGKNLIERLVQIEALRLGRAEMLKLFGREEGLEAYDILLANRKTYGEARAAIGRAGAEDLAGKMVGIPAMDPATAAAQALRIAKAREAQVVEPAGTRATAIEAGIRWMETEDRRRGMGEFRMGVRRFIRDKLTWGGAIERADVDILRDAWKRGYFDSAPPEIRGPVAELIGVDLASAAKTHAEMVSGLAPWQRQLAEGGPLMTEEENAAAMRAEWTGKLLRDAAEKLNRAAERQNAAAGGPTLSKPDRDH
jgi:hypothetical protein